jgi:hypothetical protein
MSRTVGRVHNPTRGACAFKQSGKALKSPLVKPTQRTFVQWQLWLALDHGSQRESDASFRLPAFCFLGAGTQSLSLVAELCFVRAG